MLTQQKNKTPKNSRKSLLYKTFVGLVAAVLFTPTSGCNLPIPFTDDKQLEDILPGGGDEEKKRHRIDELTVPVGLNFMKLESVALVTNLEGTGSEPPTGLQRNLLTDDMKTHSVENTNELLASPNTSLVLVRSYLPPGMQKGDPIDVEVLTPSHSKTTSLRSGWLLKTRMREVTLINNSIHSAHVSALAEGPILTQSLFKGTNDPTFETRGVILGRGESRYSRPLGLAVRPDFKSVKTSTRIACAINQRFHKFGTSKRVGIANPTRDNFIELELVNAYRRNVPRFLNVVQAINIGESKAERINRLQVLEAKLLEPTSSKNAALELEAIGKDAVSILMTGLQSSDTEVRFYSAESLAYMDIQEAAAPLGEVAESHIEFRWYALNALSAMADISALDALSGLLNSDSAETRYGAFRALHERSPDSPYIRGESLSNFKFYSIPVKSRPMIHLSMSRRPEIVVFGGDIRIQPKEFLYASKQIMIRPTADGQLRVSRFQPGKQDLFATCDTRVASLVKTIATVGGGYGDIVQCMNNAKSAGAINAEVFIGARPRPAWSYDRERTADSSNDEFPKANPEATGLDNSSDSTNIASVASSPQQGNDFTPVSATEPEQEEVIADQNYTPAFD